MHNFFIINLGKFKKNLSAHCQLLQQIQSTKLNKKRKNDTMAMPNEIENKKGKAHAKMKKQF